MKIVLNNCFGKFNISKDFLRYYKLDSRNITKYEKELIKNKDLVRYDQRLIEYIETFGSEAASGKFASLIVEYIPDGTYYRIAELDGLEWIEYKDKTKWLIAEDKTDKIKFL